MHVHFLDPYQIRSSPIHQLDPRVKLALTIIFILVTALIPVGMWHIYIMLLSIILSMEILSRIGIKYIQQRAALAIPFVLAAFPLLFTTTGHPLFNLAFGFVNVTLSLEGLDRFMSITFKSWLSIQAAILLASCTPFPELLLAMRALKVPRLLVAIFGLMWRYLFVLVDEALRLMRARLARSSQTSLAGYKTGRSIAWRARVTGGIAGNLFLRALERSDRIYMAMLARGYDGEVRSLPLPLMRSHDWLILALGLVTLMVLLLIALLF